MTPRPLRGLAAIALFSGLGWATPARADDAEKVVCVSSHVEAQRLRHAGHLVEARSRFRTCASDACPSLVAKDCASLLAEVEADMPTVVIDPRDGDRTVGGAAVFLDGVRVEGAVDGRAHDVDPGAHRLRVVAPDGRSVEKELFARVGEKNRRFEITFGAALDAAKPAGDATRPLTPAVFVAGATVVASAGVAIAFGAAALSETSCKPTCTTDEVSVLRRNAVVSDVGLGVAVAAAVVLVVVYVTRPTAAPRALTSRPAPSLGFRF